MELNLAKNQLNQSIQFSKNKSAFADKKIRASRAFELYLLRELAQLVGLG